MCTSGTAKRAVPALRGNHFVVDTVKPLQAIYKINFSGKKLIISNLLCHVFPVLVFYGFAEHDD